MRLFRATGKKKSQAELAPLWDGAPPTMSHWNVAYSMSEQLLQGHHGCRERPQKPHSRWHNPKPEGSAATLPPAHTSLPEGTPRNVDESRVCDARRPLPAAEFLSQGCFGWGSSSQWKLILGDKRALAEIRVQKSFPLGSPSRHKHRITSADPPPYSTFERTAALSAPCASGNQRQMLKKWILFSNSFPGT